MTCDHKWPAVIDWYPDNPNNPRCLLCGELYVPKVVWRHVDLPPVVLKKDSVIQLMVDDDAL